jgi:hypothetical protein
MRCIVATTPETKNKIAAKISAHSCRVLVTSDMDASRLAAATIRVSSSETVSRSRWAMGRLTVRVRRDHLVAWTTASTAMVAAALPITERAAATQERVTGTSRPLLSSSA